MAYAATAARPGRHRIGRGRRAPPGRHPGPTRFRGRARRPHQARTVRVGRGRSGLAQGRIIKTFAFRGATHLMTPEDGGVYLALRAASRMWELPSWFSYYSLARSDWPVLREVVRDALAHGPLTLEELGAAITARSEFRHLTFAFDGNPWNIPKALAWQGDLSFGPGQGRRTTFQRLDDNPRWAGIPELDEAGLRAVEAYFGAYGPATPDRVQYWLGEGLGAGRKRITAWIAGFGDRLVAVEDRGGVRTCLARASRGPRRDGTDGCDPPPPRLRPMGSRSGELRTNTLFPLAGGRWSAVRPILVTAGGVVSGTWVSTHDHVAVDWFTEAGPGPRKRLEDEVERLADDPGSAPSAVRPDRMTRRPPGAWDMGRPSGCAILGRHAPSETPPKPDRALAEQRRHRRHG